MYGFIVKSDSVSNCDEVYDRKHPPNSSVSETWTTYGLEYDGATVCFVEYDYYDLDPDGVRDAFDCKYDSVHTLTVNVSESDRNRFFMYTLYMDDSVVFGFDIDTEHARSIFVFSQPHEPDNEQLKLITQMVESKSASRKKIEDLIYRNILNCREDLICYALFCCS